MGEPQHSKSRIKEMAAFPSVATQDVHEGALCTFIQWACLADTPNLREERCMPFFSIACVQAGIFVTHGPDSAISLHPGMAMLQGPQMPYWTSHPFGLDRGCRIRLNSQLVLEAVETLQPALAETIHGGGWLRPVVQLCPPPLLFQLSLLLSRSANGLRTEALHFEETALELLAHLLQAPASPNDRPRRRSTLEQQCHWVEETRLLLARRYAENLRLEEIAQAVHTSPFHLSRIFKREVGVSLHQYRMRLRLAMGLDRLVRGERDLTELALDLGFSSHSHFTRAFSTEFGLSPRESRAVLTRRDAWRWASSRGLAIRPTGK